MVKGNRVVKIIFEIDLESGEYETEFKNISSPGEGMSYYALKEAIRRVFGDICGQVDNPLVQSSDNFTKGIN